MSDTKAPDNVFNATCPVCSSISNYVHKMQNSKDQDISYWNHCRCGVIWQSRFPTEVKEFYDQKYIDALLEDRAKYSDSCYYYSRTYATLLEELMYGRRMLDVGYTHPYNLQAFSIRGWIPFGIDINPISAESNRLTKDDFESYKFPEMVKYDLLWMNHVVENFQDPIKALTKAYDLLTDNGCIFIATPDTDMIFTNSSASFQYWRVHENYIMWNKEALTRKLEEIGFEIIMARRNHEKRFTYAEDLHIIAQKKYF